MNKSCGIEFIGNPQKLCFSGQKVRARAIVLVDKPTIVRQLLIKVRGSAGVYWNDLEKEGHMDEILYIDEQIPLLNPDNGYKYIALNPGRSTFDFTFTIPLGCPTSFESKRGRVRYLVKLVFVTNFINSQKCVGFTVIKPLNLNNHGVNLALPFCDDKEKKMWLGLSNNKIVINAKVPKTGFVPGEGIPIEVFIHNKSSSDIWELSIKLVLRAIHRTRSHKSTHKEKISLAKIKYTKAQIGKKSCFKEMLMIPPTPPSYEDVCYIFDVSYSVDVTAIFSGLHSELVLKVPVVIGSIPLGVTELRKADAFSFENYNMEVPEIAEAPFMDKSKFTESIEEYLLDMKFIPVFPKFNMKVKT
ncbi:hypothetical protein ACFFRR_000327 [Megaselia abdita]